MKSDLLKALWDGLARSIIMETTSRAKSAAEIVTAGKLPRASAYRRIRELIKEGILVVERSVLTEEGRRYDLFRSRFSDIHVDFEDGVVEVSASLNGREVRQTERFFSLDEP